MFHLKDLIFSWICWSAVDKSKGGFIFYNMIIKKEYTNVLPSRSARSVGYSDRTSAEE